MHEHEHAPEATPRRRRHPRPSRRRGFTLIEASLTTVIVGTGVLAMIEAQQAYHRKNQIATRAGTGQLLANEVRELMHGLPHHAQLLNGAETLNLGPELGETSPIDFDDLDDFISVAGGGFHPPINAMGQTLPGDDMLRWRQVVTLGGVFPSLIDSNATFALGTTEMIRVVVSAQYDTDPDPTAESWVQVADLAWVVPPTR
ncbi:type IV pilus modification PilV family protein [Phycisphaera mikurensis]|uniref:Prepilin-type N-terminal cleavage/methylation domain-containing protein n=1 Tax=Phycisphaera mikurensis (strain NBRC 102666 / KCTC 22515 / FYK2301M01) TaxID=1142394 RepID=I0IB29_PHYMF|nr:hypothetical protein [Phycisphaera mikurensis]MBB6442562.1 type II secretory pathway pseudopilin PulG [Phycisphaera mikurensis]BAM02467.1 hypothetical protein PSMK_03080 [Phycisphaera mikurensis NBRC 102666]